MTAPSETLRFTTLRVGVVAVAAGEQVVELEVRLLHASDGSYRVFYGGLSEPLPSLELAVAEAERAAASTDSAELRWRDGHQTLGPDERPCPVCGAPASTSPRTPHLLCPVCVLEATDARGRPLRFSNGGLSGGFEARYADGARYHSHECFVRGLRCRADEAKFGGIVVQPDPR
jgi:hypothetical protein